MKQSSTLEKSHNNIGVLEEHPRGVRPRFKVGDRVQVRDMPYLFYTRSQMWARGVVGTIAALTYPDLVPEDEAFNVDGRVEQYYIVRFRQKDLWPDYPFDNDTVQTESPERWLEPAGN
jgi:thiocyanate hydrolase subunit beta